MAERSEHCPALYRQTTGLIAITIGHLTSASRAKHQVTSVTLSRAPYLCVSWGGVVLLPFWSLQAANIDDNRSPTTVEACDHSRHHMDCNSDRCARIARRTHMVLCCTCWPHMVYESRSFESMRAPPIPVTFGTAKAPRSLPCSGEAQATSLPSLACFVHQHVVGHPCEHGRLCTWEVTCHRLSRETFERQPNPNRQFPSLEAQGEAQPGTEQSQERSHAVRAELYSELSMLHACQYT